MIDFNRPAIVGNELKYIQDAVAQGMLCGDGKYTKLCSEWMKKRFDVNQVFLTTSCTHALEMAAFLCDIQPGDEVIMPSYTFVSTADAFVLRGAKIVFVDIRPDTMNMDEKLIEAYREAQDIHRITASQVFHIPFDEVTDLQRRNAKAVNFGIVYGISSFGLSQDLSISKKEAAEYIERYFETYPKIKTFLDGLVAEAKEKGYVTTMFGRRRPVPELSSSNFMQRSFGERVAMNSPIQGTAADIIKIAMIRVHDRLLKENLKSRLILTVHDELLVETAIEEEDAVRKILEEEMHGAADLAVTLEIDAHVGKNWYEAK